jgi:hypothetical protein
MKGKRVQPDENGWFGNHLEPGDYVLVDPKRNADGSPLRVDFDWKKHYPMWLACSPNGHTANLHGHKITEHADGSISARPSIRITISYDRGKTEVELYHGFLTAGEWHAEPRDLPPI